MQKAIGIVNVVKTLVARNKIPCDTIVRIIQKNRDNYRCLVKDASGNEASFEASELQCFGIRDYDKRCFDIVEETFQNGHDYVRGCVHLTARVREWDNSSMRYPDFRYVDPSEHFYHFDYKAVNHLTDTEIIEILLNDVVYGVQPELQIRTLMATFKKGIDKNPNIRDGHYLLCNGLKYTVTWRLGKIIIRAGIGGGWYGGEGFGRTIYEGQVDWVRYKEALIRQHARTLINFDPFWVKFPEILESIVDKIKDDDDEFKLSWEYEKT